MRAAILDLDGTLVDSNYQHALCWYRAFREQRITIPMWRLHRHVGMGGDRYVAAVAGDDVERGLGDELRDRHSALFDEVIDEVAPLPGARELLERLKEAGLTVVLATSSGKRHLDAFLDLLAARELLDSWTGKDDVEQSKPEPDVVAAALERAGTRDAVMIGDTSWDVEAARRAGIETICLLTGGWSREELAAAGAAAVYESPAELAAQRWATTRPAR